MSSKVIYKELIAFHPGYYIKDIIEEKQMTQAEFAVRLGTTPKNLSELLAGKIKLSADLAYKLSIMLGTDINVWLNLQQTYEKKLTEIKQRKKIDEEIEIYNMIDYKYFVSLSLLPDTKDVIERIKKLCGFFNISSLCVLKERDFLVNFRSGVKEIKSVNIVNSRAWVQTAINIGSNIYTVSYDEKKLVESLQEIRALTLKQPREFIPELRRIFSECGVSFVVLPNLKNCGINGAVKWINKSKVILAINNRRRYADTFWFSLFHEIKHILQHKTRELIISLEQADLETLDRNLEQEANLFAENYLIDPNDYKTFVQSGKYNVNEIKVFAEKIKLDEGIVLGRLQNDHYLNYNQYNHLKKKYEIEELLIT